MGQQKEETDNQRHQEDTKTWYKESGSVVEKAGGDRGSCRVQQNRKGRRTNKTGGIRRVSFSANRVTM